jgi:23S rRNA G2445 N2-methylase RlmL
MRFLLTTDPGIQDITAGEVVDELPTAEVAAEPYGHPGYVRVETTSVDPLLRLRTIHHVVELRGEAEARTLEELEEKVASFEFHELSSAASFRVTSERAGKQDFSHMEIQRTAGAVIQGRYGTRVDLEGFEVNVRVDLYGHHLVAGIQRTRKDLGNRILRSRSLRTSLKPTLAAAMVRLAGAHHGEGRLIDPLCGTGTIPIEARQINSRLEVMACDWDDETVETARGTVANHELDIEVRLCDARSLHGVYAEPFDYIVTDPPYGVRQAKRTDIAVLYRALLESFEQALADSGRIVLVVLKFRAFRRALEPTGLRVVHERLVESGGLFPRIFVLERRSGNDMGESGLR